MPDQPELKSGEIEECEWNPTADRPKVEGEPCHNKATVCVGAKGQFHLCAECAALPRFKQFKKKPLHPLADALKFLLNRVSSADNLDASTITRTDTWLVYNGDPGSLQPYIGKKVAWEKNNRLKTHSGTLLSVPDKHYPKDKAWNHLIIPSDGPAPIVIDKGDLIRVLPEGE